MCDHELRFRPIGLLGTARAYATLSSIPLFPEVIISMSFIFYSNFPTSVWTTLGEGRREKEGRRSKLFSENWKVLPDVENYV